LITIAFFASHSWLPCHRFPPIAFSFAKVLLISYWAKLLSEKSDQEEPSPLIPFRRIANPAELVKK